MVIETSSFTERQLPWAVVEMFSVMIAGLPVVSPGSDGL